MNIYCGTCWSSKCTHINSTSRRIDKTFCHCISYSEYEHLIECVTCHKFYIVEPTGGTVCLKCNQTGIIWSMWHGSAVVNDCVCSHGFIDICIVCHGKKSVVCGTIDKECSHCAINPY